MPIQYVVGGLSGAGKDTLRNVLLERGIVRRGVTCTTRPKRPSEVDGRDYDFLTYEDFESLRARGEMAEETVYIGNPVAYGISWRRVEEARTADKPTMWILDTVGLERMRELFHGDVVSVYLYANMIPLSERMQQRGEDYETILRRLKRYTEELNLGKMHFDKAIDTTNMTPAEVVEEWERLCTQMR